MYMKTRDYSKEAKKLGDFLDKNGWGVWNEDELDKHCPSKCDRLFDCNESYCSVCGKKLVAGEDKDTLKFLVTALKYAAKN